MAAKARARLSRALEGEDLKTSHWEMTAIDHPHRYFTSAQILGNAWADPALFPEEVRNYVRRLRRILEELAIPVDLSTSPATGTRWYSDPPDV
jgi:DNA-binding response OmpR family regulator